MYRRTGTGHLLPDLLFLIIWRVPILEILDNRENLYVRPDLLKGEMLDLPGLGFALARHG